MLSSSHSGFQNDPRQKVKEDQRHWQEKIGEKYEKVFNLPPWVRKYRLANNIAPWVTVVPYLAYENILKHR